MNGFKDLQTEKGGWQELEKINQDNIKLNNRFNELCFQIFLDGPGKEFFKLLKEQFLYAAVANPTESSAVAYFREGQNSLVRRIMNAIQPVVNDEETNEVQDG